MQEVVVDNAGVAKEEVVTTNVRLPVTLHREMTELAATERRSLNAQIVIALEQWVERNRPKPKK
jgi:predicted HicB family RNase H-like nuclease